MKVVILAPVPPPYGGIASWASRMLEVKLKNGWNVSIVDEKLIGRSSHGDNNKKRILVEAKRCVKIWRDLIAELKNPEVKIVHACTAATTTGMLRDYISGVITRIYKKRYVIHFRCTIPNLMTSKVKIIVFKLLCNISHHVIVLNQESENYVMEKVKTSVELIPNFVENRVIKSPLSRQYSPKIKRILYTGGVTKEKGCGEIIEAAKFFPDIEFRLVGNIRDEIKRLNIPSNVILTGAQNKEFIQKELDLADLFIFFTHMNSEGFANSLVEAMGAGLPCIVSEWSANSEMIENKGGIILPIHDVDGLVESIKYLKQNQCLRSQFGEWNISKVSSTYSEHIVTDQYVDLYEKII